MLSLGAACQPSWWGFAVTLQSQSIQAMLSAAGFITTETMNLREVRVHFITIPFDI